MKTPALLFRGLPPLWIAVGIFLTASFEGRSAARADELAGDPWKLVWRDEFDGDEIDRTKWDYDIGNGFYNYDAGQWIAGWGNNELQYYTKESDNAFVRDGLLHVRALKESLHGCGYTSARLKTRKKDGTALFAPTYGKIELRAKLPTGKGVWPAAWMLPLKERYGSWAASGEIDILEARGQEPDKVLGTLHYGSRWPLNVHSGGEHRFPKGESIADFHVYGIEWDPGEIRWSVDRHTYATQSFWWSGPRIEAGKPPRNEAELNPWPAPFDQPFYLILNVAVGGNFVQGKPEDATRFPAEMQVDYVRAYERVGGPGNLKPRGKGKLPFTP